jgi:hypothetical protein
MSYAEVVEIMGEPSHVETFLLWSLAQWEDRRGRAWVHFDPQERAFEKNFTRVEPAGFLDSILAWLGLACDPGADRFDARNFW